MPAPPAATPDPAPDSLREHLDRSLGGAYRVERELGGGGMSRVFLAEERALNRRVVIKALSPQLAHDVSAERFAREIRLSARLQHPNIVPVLATGAAGHVPYYTMPFINGESLRARLARLPAGERMPAAEALGVLRDVARALNYAHGLGVVHRDIKPENVLLGNDAAMVADFGVAKALAAARTMGATSGAGTLTQDGMALGTPAYMSPEQVTGDPSMDQRADLYAWGILAYELLSGAHPFAGSVSVQALMRAHLVEMPRPIEEVAPHIAPAIRAVIMGCLEKDPAQRPSNAGVLLEALTIVVPAPRDPVVALARSGSWLPGPRWLQASGAIAVIAAIAVATTRDRNTPAAHSTPQASTLARSPGYDAYLRGRVRIGSENPADIDAAIAAFREALAADPNLAVAHAALARAYTTKAFYFAPDSEQKQLNEDAEVSVEKALALDPQLADAWFARGRLLWTPARRFPHDQAVSAYRQALALDPANDETHHQLALVFMHVGLLDRARQELDRALSINPGNTLARFRIGVTHLYQNEFEEAYKIFNSTPLASSPTLWAFQTATVLFRLGREQEAADLIDTYLRDYPRDEGGVGHSARAMIAAKAGKRAEAETAIAKAIEQGRSFGHFHHTAFNIAVAYAQLGDRVQAVRWLQAAADDGFPCYPLFAGDELLAPLRGDPGFEQLLARLRRDWEAWERSLPR